MAVIECHEVGRTFTRGDETIAALSKISLRIETGELVALTGPSGSGKSTLMYILGLLDRPSSGQYLLDDHPTEELSEDERADLRNQKIGFVFQSFHLLSRATALRNVQMPLVYQRGVLHSAREIEQRAVASLARVGLQDRMHHQPNELSGGQRQRVAIARALVNNPRLLLADEPTGNLDSRTGNDILELFSALNREGVTIVIVTHDPALAARCRRKIRLVDGQIVEDTDAQP